MKLRLATLWGQVGLSRLTTLSFVTGSHGFVAVAFFLQMVFLAKVLQVSEFGSFASAIAIGAVIEAAIGARGAETALALFVRLSPDDPVARDQATGRLLRLDLIWSAAAYAIVAIGILVWDYARTTDSHLVLVLLVGSFCAFPWGTLKAYLTVYRGARAFPPVEIAFSATSLFATVGLASVMGVLGAVIGMVIASVMRTVVAVVQAKLPLKYMIAPSQDTASLASRDLLQLGATGTLRSGFMNLASQMDILLLSAAATPTSVGLYRAAKTISGLVQRATQPVWFVLKRHIILGSAKGASGAHRRPVIFVSLGFLAIGLILVPLLGSFGGNLAAVTFGPEYRNAGQPMVWLVAGAWAVYAVTGWSSLFGSIARTRLTIIGVYVLQIAIFALVALGWGVAHKSVAAALAISQGLVAACFWLLFLRRPAAVAPSEPASDTPVDQPRSSV
jgi:O-antigen/teichoic acid export membrane protein